MTAEPVDGISQGAGVTDSDIPQDDVQGARSKYVPARDAVTGGFSKNADLISYIVAGLLLGLLMDWVFGTTPVMVIIWTLLGVGVGFWRLWQSSEELEEQARDRSHGV
ncbi:MAG: AtpZ/AtpI family protein [Acidimicrobiia bacterium]